MTQSRLNHFLVIECRENYPNHPNKLMPDFWLELSDGCKDSETLVVWAGPTYEAAKAAAAARLEVGDELIDRVARGGDR